MVGPVYVHTYVLCNNCRYSDEFNACPVYDFNAVCRVTHLLVLHITPASTYIVCLHPFSGVPAGLLKIDFPFITTYKTTYVCTGFRSVHCLATHSVHNPASNRLCYPHNVAFCNGIAVFRSTCACCHYSCISNPRKFESYRYCYINEINFVSAASLDTTEFIELKLTGTKREMNGYHLALIEACSSRHFYTSCRNK